MSRILERLRLIFKTTDQSCQHFDEEFGLFVQCLLREGYATGRQALPGRDAESSNLVLDAVEETY